MNLIEKIQSNFYPSVYDQLISCDNEIELLLLRGKSISRYCLAIFNFNRSKSIEEQIECSRKIIKKHTGAMWFFKEVGAYLVFIANQVPDHIKSDDLIVDLTGLHSVIIQGVHIITPEGDQLYNHSRWLNHAFGGANQIADKLQNL